MDVALLARLEAAGGARWNIKAHAASPGALESQRRIDLEEVIVTADLDGPVPGIRNTQHHDGTALIERDFTVRCQYLTWDHGTWDHGAHRIGS
jgi:hypothetical protein